MIISHAEEKQWKSYKKEEQYSTYHQYSQHQFVDKYQKRKNKKYSIATHLVITDYTNI